MLCRESILLVEMQIAFCRDANPLAKTVIVVLAAEQLEDRKVMKMKWEGEPAYIPVVRASSCQDSGVLIFTSRNAYVDCW